MFSASTKEALADAVTATATSAGSPAAIDHLAQGVAVVRDHIFPPFRIAMILLESSRVVESRVDFGLQEGAVRCELVGRLSLQAQVAGS